jgi:outer membrane protein insertion porin family
MEAAAQQADTDPIRRILVRGNERIEARTIESYLLLEPGQPFDPSRVDLSLKTLFATGLFADVVIARDGDDLVVQVVENPIINQVLFEGNRAIDDDKLREEIQAEPRGVFTAARVQSDVQRILEVYRRAGRFSVNVTPQYKPLDQNRVDLIFEISEGSVTGVRSINFIGNEEFGDRRLRSEIVTRQSRFWRFFSSNDNYDPDRLEYDRELLRQFYANQGYADFRVVSAVAELTPDQKDFYITFTVDEGEKYEFGEIKVETALDKLSGDALRSIVPIQEGTQFKGDLIEDTVDALTFAAGVAGYAFVDVRPRIDRDPETRKVNITFALDEGPRVYIERINIVGNTRTLDRVIRRELRISEGDAFNRVLIDQSRNRIRSLGFFKDVEITESAGSDPDRTVVDVAVEEQPTGEVSFAAGFSSVDSFLLDLNLTERNYRGRGQFVRGRIQTSSRQQTVDIRFSEPRFLDRNLVAGLDAILDAYRLSGYCGL